MENEKIPDCYVIYKDGEFPKYMIPGKIYCSESAWEKERPGREALAKDLRNIEMKLMWGEPSKCKWKIAIDPNEFRKGDLMQSDKNGWMMEVVRVYKLTKFKRLLSWLHLKRTPWFTGVKVKWFTKI